MKSNAKKILREKWIALAVFGIVTMVLFLTGIGCPIKFLTGLSCPSCGMTRAWLSFLQGHFAEAFAYHPLFLLFLPALELFLLDERVPKKLQVVCFAIMAVALIAVYIVRLWSGSPVVSFRPEEGFIYRSIRTIFFS